MRFILQLAPPIVFLRVFTKERDVMGIVDILYSALFCFAMVFALLGCLFGLVKLSTHAIRIIEDKAKR